MIECSALSNVQIVMCLLCVSVMNTKCVNCKKYVF